MGEIFQEGGDHSGGAPAKSARTEAVSTKNRHFDFLTYSEGESGDYHSPKKGLLSQEKGGIFFVIGDAAFRGLRFNLHKGKGKEKCERTGYLLQGEEAIFVVQTTPRRGKRGKTDRIHRARGVMKELSFMKGTTTRRLVSAPTGHARERATSS